MKKMLLIIFITDVLFLSCAGKTDKFDDSAIIGVKLFPGSLPYGKDNGYGETYIDDNLYRTYRAYYDGKVLIYVLNDGYIIDYFFSKIVEFKKVKDIPVGTDYHEVISMLGEPVSKIYPNIYYAHIELNGLFDNISYYLKYYQKKFNSESLSFELSLRPVFMAFDSDGKLKEIAETKQLEFEW